MRVVCPDKVAQDKISVLRAYGADLVVYPTTVSPDRHRPRVGFLFKTVFVGVDHQRGPQSVWVRVDPSADCPVCGARTVPPLDTQAGCDIAHIIGEHRQSASDTASPAGRRPGPGLLSPSALQPPGIGELAMIPSPHPRSTRQALAALQYALSTVAPPNPLVLFWRWRYELIFGTGLPVALIVLVGVPVMLGTLATLAVSVGTALLWTRPRRLLIAHAWCIITPHRVRVGCAQAWIHSRYGKIPIVLLTTRQPFGERVHLWCRAGTSAIDFTSARPLLITACWARDIRVTGNERFAQLIALDVIRHMPPGQSGNLPLGQPDNTELGDLTMHVLAPRTPPDYATGPQIQPDPPSRQDLGPVA